MHYQLIALSTVTGIRYKNLCKKNKTCTLKQCQTCRFLVQVSWLCGRGISACTCSIVRYFYDAVFRTFL